MGNDNYAVVSFETVEPRRLVSGSLRPLPMGPQPSETGGIVAPLRQGQVQKKSGDRYPIFDFKDSYYLQNGIDPTKIIGRPNGTGSSVIDNTVADPTRRNVRIKQAVGAYDDGGDPAFFAVLGLFNENAFTNNSAGRAQREIADKYIAYVFPKAGTNPLGLNKRQDDIIPLNNGYFSNNPLGAWRMWFVNYVPGSMNSGEGREVAQELIEENGVDADGTPFIRSMNDLKDAVEAGIVTLTTRANNGSQGTPWFFCPVYKDPRGGAITADATLAVVRNPDGTVHASSKDIEELFLAVKGQTGGSGSNS